jgi:hypothetical protein
MKSILNILIISIALFGCDNKPYIEKNENSFSIGGVSLGASKEELEKNNTLLSCKPIETDMVTCFIDDSKITYKLFGTTANFISIKLINPYQTISGISMSVKGPAISKNSIEKKWALQGRCLTRMEIDEATKFDNQGSGYFKNSLNEFNLLPSGNMDFICLTKNREFIKYNYYEGKEASIDIYYLKNVFANNYEYIFQSKLKFNSAYEESKIITNSKNNINKNTSFSMSCENVSHENKDYFENMEKLSKESNLPDNYFNKYHEDVVVSICNGNEKALIKSITDGYVPQEEVKRISITLGRSYKILEENIPKNLYSAHMKSLEKFNLCSACQSNISAHLSEQPNSKCSDLAKKAIQGDKNSISKLEEYPDYCKFF